MSHAASLWVDPVYAYEMPELACGLQLQSDVITEKRSIVTAWAIISISFAASGAFDFGAIALRNSVLAETAFWAMGFALVGAFIVMPLLPARGALVRLVPIACFAGAWVLRRHQIEAPSNVALTLVAFGLLSLITVSVYSSWLEALASKLNFSASPLGSRE